VSEPLVKLGISLCKFLWWVVKRFWSWISFIGGKR
jgi:hypothetical protein